MQNIILKFKEIDEKSKWDKFITENNYPTSFLQSWNWGLFQARHGQKFWRIGLFRDEKMIGVAEIVSVKAKRGNMLHLRHGPVMDYTDIEAVGEFTKYLKELGKKEGVWHVRVSALVPPDSAEEETLRSMGYKDSQMHDVDAEITWVLDLDKGENDLMEGMRKNTRNLIRRAQREGVEIIKSKNPQDIEDHFWPIFKDTVERQKWTAYDLDYVKGEFETFVKDDMCQLFLAKYEGRYIAAAIFTYFNGQTVYHHSGSLTEYRKIPASYLIQWESIKESKRMGHVKYNFWGIAPVDENGEANKNHPWYGLTFFKMGFGGRIEKWMHAKDLPVSPMYNLTRLFELIERKKRGY